MMPRVSTSRSRCFFSLSKAIAMLQSARNGTSSRVALRISIFAFMRLSFPARAAELARDGVATEPKRFRRILTMTVLRGDRGIEKYALECGERGRVNAGFAARQRVFRPCTKTECPVDRGCI